MDVAKAMREHRAREIAKFKADMVVHIDQKADIFAIQVDADLQERCGSVNNESFTEDSAGCL